MITNASQVLSIARMIKVIAETHEKSFDHDASNRALAQSIIDRTKVTDHNDFYKISIDDAVRKHCPQYLIPIIMPLMKDHWNTSTNWADQFIRSWAIGDEIPITQMNAYRSSMIKG